MAWPHLVLYKLAGLAAASFVEILGALPRPLFTAIAGLALFSSLTGSAAAMLKEPRDIETALVTFLVTAPGVTFAGVGSAFREPVAGFVLPRARHGLEWVKVR